jgi:hypothetical protein
VPAGGGSLIEEFLKLGYGRGAFEAGCVLGDSNGVKIRVKMFITMYVPFIEMVTYFAFIRFCPW